MENNICNLPIEWKDWKVIDCIGTGSYGKVYEIHRDIFGDIEKSALKVVSIPRSHSEINELQTNGYDSEGITSHFQYYAERIAKEYTLMKEIKGYTNIVCCDDIKCIQHDDGMGWDVYIKMELLTPMIKHPRILNKDIDDTLVIQFGMDMCNALIHCASKNIIHRDIKPQNIFISDDGNFKLGDFGVAKVVDQTVSGTQAGTVNYMAPEVFKGLPYDAAVDIYSLGLVMYWLLNERRLPFLPLPPKNPTATMIEEAKQRRLMGETLPPPAHGSDVLKEIVLKACAYEPSDRYASAADLLYDLEVLDPTDGVFIAKHVLEIKRKEQEAEDAITRATTTKTTDDLEAARNAVNLLPADSTQKKELLNLFYALEKKIEEERTLEIEKKKKKEREREREKEIEKERLLKEQVAKKKHKKLILVSAACAIVLTIVIAFLSIGIKPRQQLTITIQPVGVTVAEGQEAAVSVHALGEGLTYEWYYKDAWLDNFEKSSISSSTYTAEMTEARSGRQIYCVVRDEKGNSLTTKTVEINMLPSPHIISQPVSVTVDEGQEAIVTVEALGNDLTYEWYYKDVNTNEFSKSTLTSKSYIAEMNEARDGRQVYCVIKNAKGNTATTDTVTIAMTPKLQIITQPVDAAVAEGQLAVVTLEVLGENLTYEWYYKDTTSNSFSKSSLVGESYVAEMNQARSGRQIYCVVTDGKGATVTSDTVEIRIARNLQIITQPIDVTVAKGQQAVVKVEAVGEGLTYEWYYKDIKSKEFTKTIITDASYSAEMNEVRNGRQLYCVITDAKGNTVTTNTVTIKMK